MALHFLKEAYLDKKIVLVRADLNVPIKDGVIFDDTRLCAIKETIEFLKARGAKILLMSHFGRPGKKDRSDYSLVKVLTPLSQILGSKIKFFPAIMDHEKKPLKEVQDAILNLKHDEIALFENTRFYEEEEQNDQDFAKTLASYADIFVNDAFSASHRAHASVVAITNYLPSYVGFSLEKELSALKKHFEEAESPITAIIGGAKISTKIVLLEQLVTKVSALVIGGAMANTILASQGIRMGASLYEKNVEQIVENFLIKAKEHHCTIILPVDAIVASHFQEDIPYQTYGIEALPKDGMVLDIGPHSCKRIEAVIDMAKTLLWNGPLGAFEISPFDRGTIQIAHYCAKRIQEEKLTAIAGGGDTLAALKKAGVLQDFNHVSTGGGAFLEWLEGKDLPGIKALDY